MTGSRSAFSREKRKKDVGGMVRIGGSEPRRLDSRSRSARSRRFARARSFKSPGEHPPTPHLIGESAADGGQT